MKKTIDLREYKPAITSPSVANAILTKILAENPRDNIVSLELSGMITMTTQCAKIIFGSLYTQLGADIFYQNIELSNCSDGLQIVIEFGIEHALKQS